MHFVLSRVTEDDLDELINVEYRAFASLEVASAFMGPSTPLGREKNKARLLKDMRENQADLWLKLVDTDTGKIVGGANWKIYPTWAPQPPSPELSSDFYEEGTLEKKSAGEVTKDFVERRIKYTNGHPHVLLNILFTDPDYQGHGCGSMMVKWGCEVADRLFVPAWVEASAAGHRVYSANGFEDVEKVDTKTSKWRHVYTMMRRSAKTGKAY